MKNLSKRLLGERPMKLWEKWAGTFFSAFMLPVSVSLLLAVTIIMNMFVWFVLAAVFFGVALSVYATWYLWVKIPLEKT